MSATFYIWWCEVHEAAGHLPGQNVCDAWAIGESLRVPLNTPCRMVEMRLLPLDRREEGPSFEVDE